MKTFLCLLALVAAAGSAAGQADSFPYEQWTSTDGKTIEARLTKLKGKTVTLQMKKGGKRYPIPRTKLSDESNRDLDAILKALANQIAKGQLTTTTIYQGAALGMGAKLSGALQYKRLAFSVTGIRIDTVRRGATLTLDDALFLKVVAAAGRELFEKEDALYSRPSRKDRLDFNTRVNQEARLVATEGAQYTVDFGKTPVFEFGTVGVSDGIIIHR